jgi:PAS domain S-box-containing protein/excisionase family DNA binding protein
MSIAPRDAMATEALTVAQVARLLGVSPDTVYRLAAAGELPGRKIGRIWRFSRDAIKQHLKCGGNGRGHGGGSKGPDRPYPMKSKSTLSGPQNANRAEFGRPAPEECKFAADAARMLRGTTGDSIEMMGSWADSAKHPRVEEALRRSERRFRTLIERSLDLVAIVDRDGRYRYLNPAHEATHGIRLEEAVGKSAFDYLHPDDVRHLAPLLAEAIETGTSKATVEYRLRHKDGSWHTFEGIALNLFDDPEIGGVLITGRDITARRRAEERTSALLQIARDVSGTLDLATILDRVQRRTAQVLPCDVVMTFSWDKPQEVSRLLAHYGIPTGLLPTVQALRFPARSLLGGRLATGETVVVNDRSQANRAVAELFSRFGIAAMVAAPLRVFGRRVGTLVALRARADRSFETDEVELCSGIAAQLAGALEATELHRVQQEEAMVAAALARLGEELSAALNTPRLLERLCRLTTEVLGCDVSSTFLRDPKAPVWNPAATHGSLPDLWESLHALPIAEAPVAAALERLQREGVLQLGVAELASLPVPAAALVANSGITMGVCMALRSNGEVVGFQTAGWRSRQQLDAPQERIARGVSELASIALENKRLLEDLQRANRLKSDFLATMSHELRTPLNIIMGYNDLLLEEVYGPLTPEQSKMLRRTQKSATELLELITATLDIGRLEAGQSPLRLEEVDLGALLREIAAETPHRPEKAAVTVVWDVPADLPRLHIDRAKLKVVVKNLLSNGVKFTDAGQVTVRACAGGDGLELSVTDTGVGIDPEVLPIIFEPFRQGEASLTRRHGGLGLGLYITRRLVDLFQGTIAVESEAGRGSTFRLWLPRDARRTTAASGSTTASGGGNGHAPLEAP